MAIVLIQPIVMLVSMISLNSLVVLRNVSAKETLLEPSIMRQLLNATVRILLITCTTTLVNLVMKSCLIVISVQEAM